MDEIPHDKLSLADVPAPDADWTQISSFARSHNAYEALGSAAAVAELANRKAPTSLADCRVCLFFEQRRVNHTLMAVEGEQLDYMRDLIRQIRAHLS